MLTFRLPPLILFRRGSGRDVRGRISSWWRTTWSAWRPLLAATVPGVYRLWARVGQAIRSQWDCLVRADGGVHHTRAVHPPGPGGYLVVATTPVAAATGVGCPLRWAPTGGRACGEGYYARAAGTSLHLLRHRGAWTEITLPSGLLRWVPSDQVVRLGRRPNGGVRHLRWYKAGNTFLHGGLPHPRGVAMNPVDHPHGGGQGKTSGGGPGSTPWGVLTKGYKTVR